MDIKTQTSTLWVMVQNTLFLSLQHAWLPAAQNLVRLSRRNQNCRRTSPSQLHNKGSINSVLRHAQTKLSINVQKQNMSISTENFSIPTAQFSGFFKCSILQLLAADKFATKDLGDTLMGKCFCVCQNQRQKTIIGGQLYFAPSHLTWRTEKTVLLPLNPTGNKLLSAVNSEGRDPPHTLKSLGNWNK